MNRFKLKSWSLGFEVPFFDLNDTEGQIALAQGLTSKYLNWFDCLKVNLELIELANTNIMLLFSINVRVDSDLTTFEQMNSDWDLMKEEVQDILESYLVDRKLIYKVVKEDE